MRRIGYWSGPGPFTGTFTDTSAAYEAFKKTHGGNFAWVDLYTITLTSLGTVNTATGTLSAPMTIRVASVDYDVPFEGLLYAGGGWNQGWRLQRKGLKHELGTGVGELDVTAYLDGTVIDQLPPADGNSLTPQFGLAEAMNGGLFDGADVLLRRLVMPAHPTYPITMGPFVATTYGASHVVDHLDALGPGDTSLGASVMFKGPLTEIDPIALTIATWKVKTHADLLQMDYPRNLTQPTCRWTLYDKGCGLSRTGNFGGHGFQATGTISATSTTDVFSVSVSSSPALGPSRYFEQGSIQFTSGVLCGLALPIKYWDGTSQIVTTSTRAPRAPAIGDGVVLQAGCDKVVLVNDPSTGAITSGTCGVKFGNEARASYEGHIPDPAATFSA